MQCSPCFQSRHPSPLPRLPCLRAVCYVCPGAWWGSAHSAARGCSLQGQEHAATGRRRLPAAALPCTEEHARALLRPEPHRQGAGASSWKKLSALNKATWILHSFCARKAALHALFAVCWRCRVQAPVQSQERLPKRTATASCAVKVTTLVAPHLCHILRGRCMQYEPGWPGHVAARALGESTGLFASL